MDDDDTGTKQQTGRTEHVDYKGTNFPCRYLEILPVVEKFEAFSSDVCVVTTPKTGTHFMVAVLQMILSHGDPDSLKEAPHLDIVPVDTKIGERPCDIIAVTPPPRLYTTHLNISSLSRSILDRARIIYVARNPKDTIVSRYHFEKACKSGDLMHHNGSLEDMVRIFTQNDELYGPFFEHIASAWQAQSARKNVFFTAYERMIKDLKGVVMDLAVFLGEPLTEPQIASILQHCSFESMRNNDKVNKTLTWGATWMDFSVSPFMRKGKVGDWKNRLSSDLDRMTDTWIKREEDHLKTELNGFVFEYE